MIFYDFEVFMYDWLVVLADTDKRLETVIINNPARLNQFYDTQMNNIWCGFNSRFYDQYILKGIICGFNPKMINDHIIIEGRPGWEYSNLFRNIQLYNYDVMISGDCGLKAFEGFMGSDIKESSVPFDIDRRLTAKEIDEVVKYCKHDVEQTRELLIHRNNEFRTKRGLIRIASGDGPINLDLINLTTPQLSAYILQAYKQPRDDEFDIHFPPTLKLNKYNEVMDWYKNPCNHNYDKENQPVVSVAGIPHHFGYGGLHGARSNYHSKGYFLHIDVTSLYPSLMIEYNLLSRNVHNPAKFKQLYEQRLQYKREGNPLHESLKLALNSTYGAMKDKKNALYDPRQANYVCICGQLLLLYLIELLEPFIELVQSNTDGLIIRMPDMYTPDSWYEAIDEICFVWEQRTRLKLEFSEYDEIYQKDVNSYILRSGRDYKSKGAWVKKLTPLDYDLPIVNKALINRMIHGKKIEDTVNSCNELIEFQLVAKLSGKYTHLLHGSRRLKEKYVRVFASKNDSDGGLIKYHAKTGRPAKVANSPEHCFIYSESVTNVKTPEHLDRDWYINLAYKRLKEFGE